MSNEARRTVYCRSSAADDTGDGLTYATAKKTIGGAKLVMANGDRLVIGGTHTLASTVNFSALTDIEIEATGASISAGNISWNVILGSRFTVVGGYWVNGNSVFNDGGSIHADTQYDITLRGVRTNTSNSRASGVLFYGCDRVTIDQCQILGSEYGLWFSGDEDGRSSNFKLVIRDSHISTKGDYADSGSQALTLDSSDLVATNSHFAGKELNVDGQGAGGVGVSLDSNTVFTGCTITAEAIISGTTTHNPGADAVLAYGGSDDRVARVLLVGCTLFSTISGGDEALVNDVRVAPCANITLVGCNYDRSKCTVNAGNGDVVGAAGTIVDLRGGGGSHVG